MSEYANEQQAAEALSAASQADAAAQAAPAAPASPEPSAPSVVEEGATAQPDSFTNIDPNTLSPENRALYDSMHGDYTRKTQEIAPWRKLQEQGIDAERASQALQFIDALETDPNFVQAVHRQLSQALESAGLSPAEAAAEATREINAEASLGGDDYGDESDSPLAKEVAELRAWREQQELQQYEQQLASNLQRQEMAIRQADPNLTEPEMDRIYELAFAHGGNLNAAHEAYNAWKQDIIGGYVERKSAVPAGVASPVSTGHAETPTGFGSDLEKAHDAAVEHLRNVMANS